MNQQEKAQERKFFWLLLFSTKSIRSLVTCLLKDFGKLLNESVPGLLKSFNASPLLLGGDEARVVVFVEKWQLTT